MAWEKRLRGGRYYTRSKREGGRVRREYVGTGEAARLAAQRDALARQDRERERAERREARAEAEEDRLIRWYCGAVEDVLRAELAAAGFHQHRGGEWRRRRARDGMETETQKAARAEQARRAEAGKQLVRLYDAEQVIKAATVPESAPERRAVIMAALNGDAALEAQALACILSHPAELVLGWGNPKDPCLNLVSPSAASSGGRVVRAMVNEEYRIKLQEVRGCSPTPLEKLLAERIVVLRFQITSFERLYESKLGGGMTVEMSEHHVRRIEKLTKLLLKAVESLAKVRRLQLPAVMVGQVNMAERQVNLAMCVRRAEAE